MLEINKKELNENFQELLSLIKNWEGYAWTLVEDDKYIELINKIEIELECL